MDNTIVFRAMVGKQWIIVSNELKNYYQTHAPTPEGSCATI